MRKITVKHDNYEKTIEFESKKSLGIHEKDCYFSDCIFVYVDTIIKPEDLIDCYEVDVRGGKIRLKYFENKKELDYKMDLWRYCFMTPKIKPKDRNTDPPKELEINGEKFVKEEKNKYVRVTIDKGSHSHMKRLNGRLGEWLFIDRNTDEITFKTAPVPIVDPDNTWHIPVSLLKDGMVIDVSDGTLRIK